ncbi:DNA primase family protein [Treponema primitia]|uniref:DNA primase family protein n=1 Tax=Treponema primitia TaxID=88058 RepID=UPI000255585A|nr:DNA primase family protein [Treponema primitia]
MSKAIETQLKLKKGVERFIQENPQFFYLKETSTWFSFNGKIWEEANTLFESITEEIWEETELLYDVHLKNFRKLCQKKCINLTGLNKEAEMLLNTPNGVIDLTKFIQGESALAKEKKVEPHEKYQRNYLSMMTNASYIHGSDTPDNFLTFLNDLCNHDSEMVEYLLCLMAYCLTGRNNYQYLYILFGLGRNGKTAFLSLIEILLGTYFCKIHSVTLSSRTPDDKALREIYRNRFKRVAVLDELSEKYRMNIALVKQLTGGDSLNTPNNKAFYETFHTGFKLIINTNHLPEVGSTQNIGIWERLKVLVTRPPIKKEDRIEDFHLIIAEEKDKILTYLLDYYLDKALNGGLKVIPQRMALAMDFKKFQENPVEYFIDKTIIFARQPLTKNQYIKSRYLYGEFVQFHFNIMNYFIKHLSLDAENDSNKLLVKKPSETAFSLFLSKAGGFKKEISGREYWTNLYFCSERIWSENGEKIAPDWLEEKKQFARDKYSNTFNTMRQAEEALSPYVQAKAIGDMPLAPVRHFEDPEPIADVKLINNDDLFLMMILRQQSKNQ